MRLTTKMQTNLFVGLFALLTPVTAWAVCFSTSSTSTPVPGQGCGKQGLPPSVELEFGPGWTDNCVLGSAFQACYNYQVTKQERTRNWQFQGCTGSYGYWSAWAPASLGGTVNMSSSYQCGGA